MSSQPGGSTSLILNLLFTLLALFFHYLIDGRDHLIRSLSDPFQRIFQLLCVLSGGTDGNRTDILQCIEQFVIVFHVSGQLVHADHRELSAFRLFISEHADHPKSGDLPDLFLPALPFRSTFLLFIRISDLLSAAGFSETSARRCSPCRVKAARPGCGTVRSACR